MTQKKNSFNDLKKVNLIAKDQLAKIKGGSNNGVDIIITDMHVI